MGKDSAIEWTDHTWNPWMGCSKVSEGCQFCYAERDMTRFGRDFRTLQRTARATFELPLHIKQPGLIFTCSWSDFFHPDADEWRDEAWDIIRRTPHIYQILTKRPQFIQEIGGGSRLPSDWGDGWPNVWLGVSAENQPRARERIPLLLDVPAKVHFVSAEPLLGRLDLEEWLRYEPPAIARKGGVPTLPGIDWVISGGESGPNARPASQYWFRWLRDQCVSFGVPYFHKQNGGKTKVEGHWGGRTLDGTTWDGMPNRLTEGQWD